MVDGFMNMGDSEESRHRMDFDSPTRTSCPRPTATPSKLQIIRPDNDETLACVYYIHGGGMASLSSFFGNYRAWARFSHLRAWSW
jgi:acetyl esterase